jgi:putative membrane protein
VTGQEPSVQGPFDPGLQPERTELAWRRTALAIAIGSLVSLRIFPLMLPSAFAAWGFVPGAVGLVAACALWSAARRRQLRMTAWLHSTLSGAMPAGPTTPQDPPGGGMLLTLTVLATAFGVLCIAIVLVSSVLANAG